MPERKSTTGQPNLEEIAAMVFAAALRAYQLPDLQKENLKTLINSTDRNIIVPRELKSIYSQVALARDLLAGLPVNRQQEILNMVAVQAYGSYYASVQADISTQIPAGQIGGRKLHDQRRHAELFEIQEAKRIQPHTSIREMQKILRDYRRFSNAPIREHLLHAANEIVEDNRKAFPLGEDNRLRAYKELLARAADGRPYQEFTEVVVGQCTPSRDSILTQSY